MPAHEIRIGCAGWTVPAALAERAPGPGTHLERYARVLDAVEVNSTFYRAHRPSTYARWAASVPPHFRFALKLPREITHVRRLAGCDEPLTRFLDETAALGDRRGPLLIQLPPALRYEPRLARFFETLRRLHDGPAACEPRHPSWFAPEPDTLLARFRIARVAADPPPAPEADEPGGSAGLVYLRLHGSPHKYWSSYADTFLDTLARRLRAAARRAPAWCIFDNTAAGAAFANALALRERLRRPDG